MRKNRRKGQANFWLLIIGAVAILVIVLFTDTDGHCSSRTEAARAATEPVSTLVELKHFDQCRVVDHYDNEHVIVIDEARKVYEGLEHSHAYIHLAPDMYVVAKKWVLVDWNILNTEFGEKTPEK